MNRHKLLKPLSMVMLVIILVSSCDKALDNENSLHSLQTGEIEAKIFPNYDKKVSFWANAQTITIDWGDGTVNNFIPAGSMKEFTHEYANQNLQTVQITTNSLITIAGSTQGIFQELRLGNCPDLQLISFQNHLLSVFELAEANSLVWIDCRDNHLSQSSLDALFQMLPVVKEGYINYKGNSGAETCHFNIGAEKGWTEDIMIAPPSVFVETHLFRNEENIKMVLAATSKMAADFIRSFYLFESLYSNTLEDSDLANFYSLRPIYRHEIDPSNNLIANMWINAYRTINYSNRIIKELLEVNQPEYAKYICKASILRDYVYFILINCWGDLPFLNETNLDDVVNVSAIKRESQITILSELIANLLQIEQNLPESESDSYFVQLLLSKIYTYQKNYTLALQYALKPINSNHFVLSTDYYAIFNNRHNNELMSEFVTTYELDNNQYEISLIKKGEYMPVARYAEVLLLAAENSLQLNERQDAIEWVNELRLRNERPLLESNAAVAQIKAAILEEYKLDLGKEGLYFFALKRFNMAESALNLLPYQLYLPVPSIEIDVNPNIIQNQGY